MSGIAIVLENADFSQKNIGQVNFITDVPVEGISITGAPSYGDTEVTLGIEYTPVGTSQRGVDWSVVSGAATINQVGVLVPDTLVDTDVVVSAVSKFNPNVYATKNVSFSYDYMSPAWKLGFYDRNYGTFNTSGGGRYYGVDSMIDVSLVKSITCVNGFYFRVVWYSANEPTKSNLLGYTDTITSCEISQVMPTGARYIGINVNHTDVTGTNSGTVMTQEEVARLNEIVKILCNET